MNKRYFADNIGHIIKLRPNPILKKQGKPIKESVNEWTIIDFQDKKTVILQHNHSDYRLQIESTYVRKHEPPDMIILRGQVTLEENRKYSFVPFTEGLTGEQDLGQLVDDPSGRTSPFLYNVLKPHEGEEVTIRFPKGSDGTVYYEQEAILEEVTPHFVKLYKPAIIIKVDRTFGKHIKEISPQPNSPAYSPTTYTTPEERKSIALDFLKLEEEGKKIRLVTDYSNWNPDDH